MTLRVRDLDESGLLARIVPLLPAGPATLVGPGDDAAVVAAPDGRYVVSTDVLVEDFHFRRRWSTGYDVGVRAAAQTLADVAAMGGRPTALVVGLAMPADLEVAWVEGLARGLADACLPAGAAVVGGDLSGGSVVMVSVAVHGDLGGRPPVLRSGARPGDVVAHAGVRGFSAAGLALLEAGAASPADGAPGAAGPLAPFVTGFLRPTPPLESGPAANLSGATAMLDVSDGLLRDAGRIATASGVVIDLDSAALEPYAGALDPASTALGAGRDTALAWVLAGGEDHGLLATFPPTAALPPQFRRIGHVTEGTPTVLLDGSAPPTGPGWDHFRA